MDQGSIEDLFERNADMRLLEFRNTETGKPPQPTRRTGSSFSAESIVSGQDDIETEATPRMRVAVAAAPSSGVIPGAVIGVAIDVFNDGNAPAPESQLLVSLPHESEYRSGTLRVDGREVQVPEALFAAGLPIARLPGATSSKVTFQLAILPGISALYLQPRLQTNGVPVVGTAGISIKRGSSATAAVVEAPKPFYELEDDEIADVAAETAADILPPVLHERAEPVAPVAAALPNATPTIATPPIAVAHTPAAAVTPPVVAAVPVVAAQPVKAEAPVVPAPAPVVAEEAPVVTESAPAPVAEAAPAGMPAPTVAPAQSVVPAKPVASAQPVEPAPAVEPPKTAAPKAPAKPRALTKPAAPENAPDSAAPEPAPMLIEAPPVMKPVVGTATAAEERLTRYRTLGTSDIALLERLFVPEVPGVIAHYVVISSIACNESASGTDESGYDAFLRRDIELLGRALVHSRMGKAPQYRIVQDDLSSLHLEWQNVLTAPAFPAPRRLRRDLRRAELTAVAGLIQPSERDATLRTRIALLALAGSTLDGVDTRTADDCAGALAAYRSAVLAWLVPLCVASAGTESFVIPAPPATVDAAGRRLVSVLKLAVVS